ncbi:MAG: hypothetical protein A2015_16545 [Spirochaetes bacterium GWF1_31_7]|nr:MAG: hypothetical protein A2Y30_13910 [Spirochaetes bacterium GWE1_32_154]OHD50054.1 MAG: hypothetical protein A2Y29_11955 [Spirochaetes bacterium GWE2_31_10]OHD52368.1 MAG: hypothetical protein A2015_16545 [Spirochaetes bacterium GWF1_31_7]OHD81684.1 MAG: hypothetical protein A2355_07395 [Spirochaetes bacterium RIFOXYB1_FULL_32_8]HBD96008.1 hypothetical protein [Spirochaetia bacterium]
MSIKIISCSIFKNEIRKLIETGELSYQVDFIDSMLHIYPEKLQIVLENYVNRNKHDTIVITYGDCYPYMLDLENQHNIARTPGINCCEIILGHTLYSQLRKEGAFFMMPEWTTRWKEVFKSHLGLTQENAGYLMKEFHTKLIYLDTGLVDIPYKNLENMSDYVGLPYEILSVSLSNLKDSLQSSIEKVRKI